MDRRTSWVCRHDRHRHVDGFAADLVVDIAPVHRHAGQRGDGRSRRQFAHRLLVGHVHATRQRLEVSARYIAPVSRNVQPRASATARATVDLPEPAGPSMAMIL